MHRVRTWKGPYLHHQHILQILLSLVRLLFQLSWEKCHLAKDGKKVPHKTYEERYMYGSNGCNKTPFIGDFNFLEGGGG